MSWHDHWECSYLWIKKKQTILKVIKSKGYSFFSEGQRGLKMKEKEICGSTFDKDTRNKNNHS